MNLYRFWQWLRTTGWLRTVAFLRSTSRDPLRLVIALALDIFLFLLSWFTLIHYGFEYRLSFLLCGSAAFLVAPQVRSLVEAIVPDERRPRNDREQ